MTFGINANKAFTKTLVVNLLIDLNVFTFYIFGSAMINVFGIK